MYFSFPLCCLYGTDPLHGLMVLIWSPGRVEGSALTWGADSFFSNSSSSVSAL